jgi:SprT protein
MNRIEMLQQVTTWSHSTWSRLEKMYPGQLGAMPEIKLNARLKTTAGRCFWELRVVDFSVDLLGEYPEHFRMDTVPHELAHQVAYDIWPASVRRCHGAEWQSVMRRLGLEPSRCHDLINTKHAARRANAV